MEGIQVVVAHTLGRLQQPSTASPAAWAATGAAIGALLPPRRGRSVAELESRLAEECAWLLASDVVPDPVVAHNRRLAQTVLRHWTPVFMHGDLRITHVFVSGDQVSGIIDWSEASQGDALYDLATVSLAHEEHLEDLICGYGGDVDRGLIRAWWSFRKPDRDQMARRERVRLAGDVPRGRVPAIVVLTPNRSHDGSRRSSATRSPTPARKGSATGPGVQPSARSTRLRRPDPRTGYEPPLPPAGAYSHLAASIRRTSPAIRTDDGCLGLGERTDRVRHNPSVTFGDPLCQAR